MPTFPWMLDVEAQMPPPGEWKTPPFDPRFPNQNQTRNCYQNFLDYHRCVKSMSHRGKNTQPCEYYYRVFHSLCPISWVQRWTEQIKQGTFPGKNLTVNLSAAPLEASAPSDLRPLTKPQPGSPTSALSLRHK